MEKLEGQADPSNLPPAKDSMKKCKVMNPAKALTLRNEGYGILGVDLTTIPGISVLHVQTILAELGPDHSKFRNAAAFSSWMGLCPDNDISGGRVLWSGTRKVKNRIALALRMAAQSLQQSQSSLGEFYRRMRTRLGAPKAITAAAHKLARIVFRYSVFSPPRNLTMIACLLDKIRGVGSEQRSGSPRKLASSGSI